VGESLLDGGEWGAGVRGGGGGGGGGDDRWIAPLELFSYINQIFTCYIKFIRNGLLTKITIFSGLSESNTQQGLYLAQHI